jgi:hypothetical protein
MKKLIAYIIVALILIGSILKGLDSAIEILEVVPW